MPPGKDLIGSHTRYSLANAGQDVVVLGSNARRVGLVISAPSTSTISVRFGDATGIGLDIQITAGSLPWCVTLDDIGTLIQQPVHLTTVAGIAKGGIIETSTR